MIHFFRLVRPINLLIIALTMYGIKWFTEYRVETKLNTIHFSTINFFLFVLSVVLIAASGNIINDYFDVRADRINRPDRLLIGKHIKRRWAIVLHWSFNIVAFGIGLFLSYKFKTGWIIGIHLFSINILWFYSVYFKRKIIIGNILIALLTALVPILCGIYLKHEIKLQSQLLPDSINLRSVFPGKMIFILACLAFVQNWIREIVKDAQDIKGDLAIKAKTLPMILSKKTLALTLTLLLLILPAFIYFHITFLLELNQIRNAELNPKLAAELFNKILFSNIPLYMAGILNFLCIFLLWNKESIPFRKIDIIIKISLLIGLLLPIYRIFYQLFIA